MSLEDLFESEEFLIAVFFIIVLLWFIFFPIRDIFKKKLDKSIYGETGVGEYREEKDTILIEKRTMQNPLKRYEKIHSFLFEFTSGERVELAVKDIKDVDLFYHSVVGDKGTLRYQGSKFIEFERYKKDLNNES